MNTFTNESQTLEVFNKTAEDIVETIEQMGFTTEQVVVNGYLKSVIVEILNKNLVGNTNYNSDDYFTYDCNCDQCQP